MSRDIVTVDSLLRHPQYIKFAYQPIYKIEDNSIYGFEGLMRPAPFSPVEFIEQVAKMDKLHLIEEITNYYGVKHFMDAGLEGRLFLNTFPSVCMRIHKAKKVARLGGEEMSNRLVYEVVEYTKFERYAWAMKKVAFKSEGANPLLAIDDFGTGRNIDDECLNFYEPDIVKIDRKYVSNIDNDIEKQKVVEDMIEELRDRNITILAEGVETLEEFNYFKAVGVDLMQGFFLGKPMFYD